MTKRLSAFPITPADEGGHVDVAALRRLVAPLAAAGVDSIGLLGSTGISMYLDRVERRRALDAALDEVAGAVPILVGVGALRTDEAIRLATEARAAGAAAGLLAPVSYTPLSEDEVFAHTVAVADGSGLPLCVYDNPATTHFRFTPALLARLAAVPGITAVKSPGAGPAEVAAHLAGLRPQVPAGFDLGISGDGFAAEALLAGADTWYAVAAGLFPRVCLDVTRAAGSDAAATRAIDARLAPLWDLFRRFTSLRVMYAAADWLGLCRVAPPRPVLPLDAAACREVGDTLGRLGLA
jgi:4-hydroxy-tetrahydrodipicolinate synthase